MQWILQHFEGIEKRAKALDICRTETGLKMLETNCIDAAGVYAADLLKLADAIHHQALARVSTPTGVDYG